MNDLPNTGAFPLSELAFDVRQFGPIKTDSTFTVKPLTLLCGPNNAGKTWVMYALYGFLSRFAQGAPLPEIGDIAKTLAEQGEYQWDMVAWLTKHGQGVIDIIHQGTNGRLPRIFSTEAELLKPAAFNLKISSSRLAERCKSKAFDFRLSIGREKNDALRIYKAAGEDHAQLTLLAQRLPDLKFRIADAVMDFLLDLDGDNKAFLMPAERNGLHLFFRELASTRTALLHHATKPEIDVAKLIKDVISSRYAEPIADYIDWLNVIHQLRKQRNNTLHHWAEQVKQIAGGRYDVDAEGNIFFTPGVISRNTKGAPKLGLHMTSSTAKSLFGLWFYLEHEAKPGDTLMIDEPELNLHPDNQRKVAKLLVQLVNAGIRVVISTHSDYMVREINNLIMLNTPFPGREDLIKKFHYEGCDFLNPEYVAAYLFDRGSIQPMEIDENEGIIAATFDNVINALNRSSDEIFYTRRDSSEDSDVQSST
ncbi:AAA family ATPase [Methylococcus sp. ANG]|uniref:AAA family ATPase n=1 Tax=Methylococcus sp. ANG TaxID=3231903 RepID=UPI0034578BAA